jgi:hypothetical protein
MNIIDKITHVNQNRVNKRGNHHMLPQQKCVKKSKRFPDNIEDQVAFR